MYCGVPAANSAFAAAQRVLAEEDGGAEGGRHHPLSSADPQPTLPRGRCLAGPRHRSVRTARVRQHEAPVQLGLRAGHDAVHHAGGGVASWQG